uniref:Putative ovule protein n=1 Tax=Solanum chacoense TaxID=4108 RepID=A0A0V0GWY6_SOLCH
MIRSSQLNLVIGSLVPRLGFLIYDSEIYELQFHPHRCGSDSFSANALVHESARLSQIILTQLILMVYQ